jgi:hypothetical protein
LARRPGLGAATLAGFVAAVLTPNFVEAADRNADFLVKLRERGWDDTAVEYLDWVEKSPLITAEFRKDLAYQRAVSRAAEGRQARGVADRERLLTAAAADFIAFAKEQPESDAALDALRQAANLHAEQALSVLAAAKQLPDQAAAQREEARRKARASFTQASEVTKQVIALCAKALAALPKPTAIQGDAEAKARRDQLRNRQVEGRFLAARLAFEQAATYEPNSKEYSQALEASSNQFGQLVEEYRDSLVGATSRFYQGRCAQELGAYEKALGCYQDLIRLPAADPEFRRWTSRAHRRRTECLLAIDKLDDAISAAEEWIAASRPAEREQPEWLEVQYRLAEAYRAKQKEDGGDPNEAKQFQTKARNLMRDVAKHPNEFQQDARLALASLGQRSTGDAELKTFDEAFDAGKTSLELWNSSTLAAKLARENNPDAEKELKEDADGHRSEALRTLELAVDLASSQTPLDQLNAARYYLCVLYWEDKRVHEAAVLAEFLARRYPEGEFAAGAAKVALAAYEQLAIESRARGADASNPGAASYEARKLAELSELVAARWPESPEASSAVNVLIQTALRENRLSDAEALLGRLPPGSRSAAELSLGAGLWTQYLRTTAGQREQPSPAAISLRDKAGALLKQGFESVRKSGNPTPSTVVGSLYLVQYLLAQGDSNGALDVLEDKAAGPLTLVAAEAEAAKRPEFVQETYKAALRAYLSAEPPQREKAEQMMKSLEHYIAEGGGEKSAQQLTEVYLSLGIQLQRQMKELTSSEQDAKAEQLAAAFGDLLARVSKRPDANSWRIRTWLAQTNLQIGQALRGEEAKAYVNRAQQAYEAILESAEKDKNYAPNATALLAVRMRLGECLAALGQYDKAIEQYAAILREKPNMLDLQQAAATSLQEWGVAKRDAAALDRAIRGDLPQKNGKNLIWGWLQLATMADNAKRQAAGAVNPAAKERSARFEDLFFEARYNIAKSRYLAGAIAPEASRQQHLEAARTNIAQMARLYPELGGPKWKAAFDDLSNQIDAELAKK